MAAKRFGDMRHMAETAVQAANDHLYEPDHAYHVKDTHTRDLGDETAKEMSKTLDLFRHRQRRPAFGIEGSKNLPPPMRTYYHLRVIESFLRSFGISFERTFSWAPPGGRGPARKRGHVLFRQPHLPRPAQRPGPPALHPQAGQRRGIPPRQSADGPGQRGGGLKVYFGNTNVTNLDPQYLEFDASIDHAAMEIDGRRQNVSFGSVVPVGKTFRVEPQQGYRTNVIGFPGRA